MGTDVPAPPVDRKRETDGMTWGQRSEAFERLQEIDLNTQPYEG